MPRGQWDSIDALVETAYAEFGKVDILVNNAGMSPPMPSPRRHRGSCSTRRRRSTSRGRSGWRARSRSGWRRATGGLIINVSSSGALMPLPAVVPYGVGEGGAQRDRRGRSPTEYGPKVRVNTILPGPFLTDIAKAWDEEARRSAPNALGRPGDPPEEIVTAALFLASPMSSFTTGAIIRVDGGLPIGQ